MSLSAQGVVHLILARRRRACRLDGTQAVCTDCGRFRKQGDNDIGGRGQERGMPTEHMAVAKDIPLMLDFQHSRGADLSAYRVTFIHT